jgi:hypothetical protein
MSITEVFVVVFVFTAFYRAPLSFVSVPSRQQRCALTQVSSTGHEEDPLVLL